MTFLLKIEWVSKNTVFFFSPTEKKKYRLLKRVSEWVLTFSGKKKNKNKKIQNSGAWGFHEQTLDFSFAMRLPIKEYLYHLWNWKFARPKKLVSGKIQHFSWNWLKYQYFFPEKWSECTWTFFGKKKIQLYFFFSVCEKKKYNFLQIWVSEWPSTFPGKKKYGTFART